jgi:hypothetical protein
MLLMLLLLLLLLGMLRGPKQPCCLYSCSCLSVDGAARTAGCCQPCAETLQGGCCCSIRCWGARPAKLHLLVPQGRAADTGQ